MRRATLRLKGKSDKGSGYYPSHSSNRETQIRETCLFTREKTGLTSKKVFAKAKDSEQRTRSNALFSFCGCAVQRYGRRRGWSLHYRTVESSRGSTMQATWASQPVCSMINLSSDLIQAARKKCRLRNRERSPSRP